jgi:DNA-binding beta-propeller fold protein YncE
MSTQRSNSMPRKARTVLALVLLSAVAVLPAFGRAKKKNAAGTDGSLQPKTVSFDISKIVWPNPPAIARVRFVNILSGQKIDWADLKGPQKHRQSWMDRLAGTQPDSQFKDIQSKVGFQLIRPYGVAVDSHGNIYTADQGVGAIFIFDGDSGKVQLIKNGVDAHFARVNGLAMDDDDRLFVTDSQLHHVLVFNRKHEQEAVFGAADLVSPCGIAIDTENRFVYVVDTQLDQVLVFDADNYKLLRRIGTSGKNHTLTSPGNFSLPTCVAVDKDGNVYVTDTLNDRVQIFDADGNFISQFGQDGDGPGRFARPKGIAIDCDGHIWVADEVQSRVQVFDKEGRLLIYFGEEGWYPGQFRALYDVAFDKKDNAMITSEQWPGRLQVFHYVTDGEAAQELARREGGHEGTPSKVVGSPSQKGGGQIRARSSTTP